MGTFLDGYKTYIAAALIGAATALKYAGIVTEDQYTQIQGILAAFALYAVRSAIAKIETAKQ